MDMDPSCNKDLADRFNTEIQSMLKIMDIEDDRHDIINKLKKIELELNKLCEARNFLQVKDKREKFHSKGLE